MKQVKIKLYMKIDLLLCLKHRFFNEDRGIKSHIFININSSTDCKTILSHPHYVQICKVLLDMKRLKLFTYCSVLILSNFTNMYSQKVYFNKYQTFVRQVFFLTS